eukprot:5220759-Pleurochrysis_carterae.AAC.1
MPTVRALKTDHRSNLITFPQCALGADSQKYTTLLVSPGISPMLRSLSDLCCEHHSHASIAGGRKHSDQWSSAASAAYPPDLNFLLAKVLASAPAHAAPSNVQTTLSSAASGSRPQLDTVSSSSHAPPSASAASTESPVADATVATTTPDAPDTSSTMQHD